MINSWRLENVLPACLYSPTYVVKDFPIARYQGLQFVSHIFLTFVWESKLNELEMCAKIILVGSSEERLLMAVLFQPAKK